MAELTGDLSSIVLATVFGTIACVLFLLWAVAGRQRSHGLVLAGLFAALYGARMIFDTGVARSFVDPVTLRFINNALEYLVPVPAAFLFAHYFGATLRRLNITIAVAFSAFALVAIPYEWLIGQPFALKWIIDALVVAFMVGFVFNLVLRWRSPELRVLRYGALVFVIFVLNQHFMFFSLPWGLSAEPVGFLVFLAAIVVLLVRRAVSDQGRLVAVDSELSTARAIQESIIPSQPPAMASLDIAAVYRPASHVGGDFYDFVPLSSQRLGIFIADVVGHGVPAALVASMLKIGVAAQDDLASPSSVLDHLNAFFCGRFKRQFFTAMYAVVDPSSKTVTVAAGGHPPMLLARNGSVSEVDAHGFVIGRMRNVAFEPRTEAFDRGDVAVLYTDGIVEASRDGEVWGYERLRRSIETHRDESAQSIAGRIISDVDAWSEGSAGDDLTLVVVKSIS